MYNKTMSRMHNRWFCTS